MLICPLKMVIFHRYGSLPEGIYKAEKLLVGGIPTPLKNMSSSVGMIIPN